MNVSCRGVLMKEVASEKEAMDEIKRYLEVNGLKLEWVSITLSRYSHQDNDEVIDERKYICAGGEQFVIRHNSPPPYNSIDELSGRVFIDKKEFRNTWYVMSTSRMAVWAEEFRNYIQDLNRRLRGA